MTSAGRVKLDIFKITELSRQHASAVVVNEYICHTGVLECLVYGA